MKTNILTIAGTLLMLSACGTASQYASSQQFQDGFYSRPANSEIKAANTASKSEVSSLINETENSRIFLKAGQTDTLFVPENMSTTLKFDKQSNSTVVTVTNTPSYSLYPEAYMNYGYSYWPGMYWSSWYSPWQFTIGWGVDPWIRYNWNPWYWGDPWYSSRYWYDPWFYGPDYYWAWHYDPWYGPWHHHHGWCDAGFGPGFRPSWGEDIHWGSRAEMTGRSVSRADAMGVVSSSVRRGTSPSVTRQSSLSSVRRVSSSTSSNIASGNVRTTSSSANSGIRTTQSSYNRSYNPSSSSSSRSAGGAVYRRPANSRTSSVSSGTYRSSTGTSSGYSNSYRSTSSSSAYRSSASSSNSSAYRSSSSSYSGGATRSSSFSGGGYSGGGASRSYSGGSSSGGGSTARRR